MGMLTDGAWSDADDRRSDKQGAFERVESKFRDRVSADGAWGFKAEPGRYHLYIAHNCPWAHRAAIFRKIKKLEEVISMTVSDRPKLHGWGFSELVDVAEMAVRQAEGRTGKTRRTKILRTRITRRRQTPTGMIHVEHVESPTNLPAALYASKERGRNRFSVDMG